MRVLQVISTLNIGSGIASVVMNYYRNINRKKVQFDFLLFNTMPTNFEEEARALGAKIFFVDKPCLRTMFAYKAKVEEVFAANIGRWGAVHIHEVLVQAVILPLAKKYGIDKRLLHAHGGMMNVGRMKRLRNKILDIGSKKNATFYLACSQEAGKAQFGKNVVNSNKFQVICNGIEPGKFVFKKEIRNRMRNEFNLENKFVIGHIGRFSEEKNHKFIIDMFSEFLKKDNNAVLVLVGDGKLKTSIEEQIKRIGIEPSVIILSQREDINNILQMVDCFVFPSLFEGLGIVLIEAQASGLPCVASVNVPRATKLTELVEYLPLENICKWIDTLADIKNQNIARENTAQLITAGGYNIYAVVSQLFNIYRSK